VNKQKDSGRPRRYLRKKAVAERYGVHERSVDRMKTDGRLPPPDFYNGRFPLWDEAKLDASDRRAALLPRPTQAA
jgi:predicted DNA-binding transcriptional regulator AlpA